MRAPVPWRPPPPHPRHMTNAPHPQRAILHVYAHPDDESFGNPATFALCAHRGMRLGLLTLTRGEAGRTNGVCQPHELGDVREAELRAACRALGVGRLALWNYPDGGLGAVEDASVLPRIAAFLRAFSPDVVVTYGADGVTGHPDHVAVGRWTSGAFHQLRRERPAAAPGRLYYRATPEKRRALLHRPDLVYRSDYTTIIDGREFPDARLRAQACHRSQRQPTDYARPEMRGAGLVDYYRRIYPAWEGGPLEADLFGDAHHADESALP